LFVLRSGDGSGVERLLEQILTQGIWGDVELQPAHNVVYGAVLQDPGQIFAHPKLGIYAQGEFTVKPGADRCSRGPNIYTQQAARRFIELAQEADHAAACVSSRQDTSCRPKVEFIYAFDLSFAKFHHQ
jgi:hypothetical protein